MLARSRRWAYALVCSAIALSGLAAGAPQPAGAAGPFQAHGSLEQVYVTHAVPGDALDLRDASSAVVAQGTVDDLGSFLFHDVAPGDGYTVLEHDAGGDVISDPLHVLGPTEVPLPTLYSSQVLPTTGDGFGFITTRDGTKLSITVKLPGPADQGPYPTVVEYSGYDPSNPHAPQPSTLVSQLLGYATVGVNVRGTGCSGGAFNYFEPLSSLDGYDVIETIAAQPWVAFGKVGMVGISYAGISQLFVAQTQPPHLAAIAPLSVIADTYRSTLYPGGIFNDGFALQWAQDRVNGSQPYGQGWEHGIVDAGGANGSQCAENQLLRRQNQDIIGDVAANTFYAPAGDVLAPVTFVDKVNVPTFMGGAWQDEQTGGHFSGMWKNFTLPDAKLKLFATNGTHADSWMAQINRWYEFLEFYVARRIPQASPFIRAIAPFVVQEATGISGVQLEPDRFTGYPTYAAALAAYEAEAPVRILLENGNGTPGNPGAPTGTKELAFSSWPPPQTVASAWYFQPDQHLSATPPTVADADGKASTQYFYDPQAKPKTDFSGSSSAIWGALPAYDWRPLPIGKALAFDSPPLDTTTVMAGQGSVDLWLRSTEPDTDVEVTLTELRPDGQEMYVQNGWLRASHRRLDAAKSTALAPWHTHLAADAAPLPPNQFASTRVELFPFAHVFRAGSRIRITVEAPGGNRPLWTFADLAANGQVFNEIAHSVGRPSKIVLPVIPDVDGVPAALAPCPSLRGQPCRTAYRSSVPFDVHAQRQANGDVDVSWESPPDSRPDAMLTGYRVTDSAGGSLGVAAGVTNATFTDPPDDFHSYKVTALFTDNVSAVSTPSETVTIEAAPTTTTSTTTTASTTTTSSTAPVSAGPATLSTASTTTPATIAAAAAVATSGGATGQLPFNGSGLGTAVVGALALLIGSALVALSRRRARGATQSRARTLT